MDITVKGQVKQIGKKEFVNRYLYQRNLVIETESHSILCIKLQSFKGKPDYTQLIEQQKLEEGDVVQCKVTISSRPWQYTYITNITSTELKKQN